MSKGLKSVSILLPESHFFILVILWNGSMNRFLYNTITINYPLLPKKRSIRSMIGLRICLPNSHWFVPPFLIHVTSCANFPIFWTSNLWRQRCSTDALNCDWDCSIPWRLGRILWHRWVRLLETASEYFSWIIQAWRCCFRQSRKLAALQRGNLTKLKGSWVLSVLASCVSILRLFYVRRIGTVCLGL